MESITFSTSSKQKSAEPVNLNIKTKDEIANCIHSKENNNGGDFSSEKKKISEFTILRNHIGINNKQQLMPHYLNGFVGCMVDAYNNHLNVVIKPDHVWMSILSQFAFYIQHNAESLRSKFVSHEGKIQLTVREYANINTADMGGLSMKIIEQMKKHLKNPNICKWLIPTFTTTELHDKVCYSVSLMGAMQDFFSFKFELSCGIPNVTLLGTVEDWEKLRRGIDNLLKYDLNDEYISKWYSMLVPVLDEFVSSRKGNRNLEFWDRVCSHLGGGSGPSYLSGWITAFCVFSNEKGAKYWLGEHLKRNTCYFNNKIDDNTPWPIIDTNYIPSGIVSVPVIVDDNGVTEYNTQMFSGCLSEGIIDKYTITPENGWCMTVKEENIKRMI